VKSADKSSFCRNLTGGYKKFHRKYFRFWQKVRQLSNFWWELDPSSSPSPIIGNPGSTDVRTASSTNFHFTIQLKIIFTNRILSRVLKKVFWEDKINIKYKKIAEYYLYLT
jgi:hypothetical protein